MVKRTRRNLSDPRIKKIIKAQTYKNPRASKGKHNRPVENSFGGKLFLPFLLILFVSISAILVYLKWSDIRGFLDTTFSSQGSSAKNELVSRPAAGSRPVLPAQQQEAKAETQTPKENPVEVSSPEPVARRIQVEVLNGCGKAGLAKEMTVFLRRQDIDVVSQGNYANFDVARTFVYDHIDNPERVNKIVRILGISAAQIQIKKDNNLQLDATIVLGADYKSLKPFTK